MLGNLKRAAEVFADSLELSLNSRAVNEIVYALGVVALLGLKSGQAEEAVVWFGWVENKYDKGTLIPADPDFSSHTKRDHLPSKHYL